MCFSFHTELRNSASSTLPITGFLYHTNVESADLEGSHQAPKTVGSHSRKIKQQP
jgi:hypothetical protein